jgi:hypothetical protein
MVIEAVFVTLPVVPVAIVPVAVKVAIPFAARSTVVLIEPVPDDASQFDPAVALQDQLTDCTCAGNESLTPTSLTEELLPL